MASLLRITKSGLRIPILIAAVVSCFFGQAFAQQFQPRFLSSRDLLPMKDLSANDIAVWKRHLWPIAKLQNSTIKRDQEAYLDYLDRRHSIGAEERQAYIRLAQVLMDPDQVRLEASNGGALSQGFSELEGVEPALLQLSVDNSGQTLPVVRSYNALQDEMKSFESFLGNVNMFEA